MRDKPGFLSGAPRLQPETKRRLREHWRCGLASLVAVDRDVHRLYKTIKRSGELHKTVFIFISDNGLYFGEHRIPGGKVLPYEEGLRLPLCDQGAEALSRRRRSRAEGQQAGREHRPGTHHSAPGRGAAVLRTGEVPHDGRALPDATAEGCGALAWRSRTADRVPGRRRRPVRNLRVRRDQDAQQHVRPALQGRQSGYERVRRGRSARALQPQRGSVRAAQPVLRRRS